MGPPEKFQEANAMAEIAKMLRLQQANQKHQEPAVKPPKPVATTSPPPSSSLKAKKKDKKQKKEKKEKKDKKNKKEKKQKLEEEAQQPLPGTDEQPDDGPDSPHFITQQPQVDIESLFREYYVATVAEHFAHELDQLQSNDAPVSAGAILTSITTGTLLFNPIEKQLAAEEWKKRINENQHTDDMLVD